MSGAATLLRCGATALALGWAADSFPEEVAPGRPNSLVIVARPAIDDPNFSRTAVVVTRTPEWGTVGVILNRPGATPLSAFLPPDVRSDNYRQPVYFGGPVMPRVIVALFQSTSEPPPGSFRVLPDVYLSMQPEVIAALLGNHGAQFKPAPGTRYRLYAGFSGWAPRQLENELNLGGWYTLAATPDLLFAEDTANLWQELVERAAGTRAQMDEVPGDRTVTVVTRERFAQSTR